MVTTFDAPSNSRRVRLMQQTKSLDVILHEEFGAPFTFYDATSGLVVRDVDAEQHLIAAPHFDSVDVLGLLALNRPLVNPLDDGRFLLAIPLFDPDKPLVLALAALPALAQVPAERVREQFRLEKWIGSLAERLRHQDQSVSRSATVESKSQSNVAWRSLLSFDKLFRRLRIHKDPTKYRLRILEAAMELLNVQTVVWVSQNGEQPLVSGEPCMSSWDCQQLTTQIAKEAKWDDDGVLVCNNVSEQSWGSRCANVVNLCAITVSDQRLSGWVIAINKLVQAPQVLKAQRGDVMRDIGTQFGSPAAPPTETIPFNRTDAAILTPYLSLLGMYLSASQRFHSQKELMVGLARSLTASIDAKDQYTFGHSERVARISMELGTELGLGDDELNDIYLTGLLHDIGKIGVPDAVLSKPGPLTTEEMDQVKQHVTIGYKILSGLRSINHLLPGVLYHHERIDGAGYPEGLKGETIPMLARIIAVADGYDAMSSSRPYRAGMPLDRVEEILYQGAGTQWDSTVIKAFRRCRQRIHAIRQRGIGDSLRYALDGMMRDQSDDQFDGGSSASKIRADCTTS